MYLDDKMPEKSSDTSSNKKRTIGDYFGTKTTSNKKQKLEETGIFLMKTKY